MRETYRVLIATFLSFTFITGWSLWTSRSIKDVQPKQQKQVIQKEYKSLDTAIKGRRIKIKSEKLLGSVNLQGLKIDQILLLDYLADDKSGNVLLLKPQQTKNYYLIDFDWSSKSKIKLPDENSFWSADSDQITTAKPVNFYWDNQEGVRFNVQISIDEKYLISIKKWIENNSLHDIDISYKARSTRSFTNIEKSMLIMHEGPIGVLKNNLLEFKYKEIIKNNKKFHLDDSFDGRRWFGFSDKYWLVSQIINQDMEGKININHRIDKNSDHVFTIESISANFIIKPESNHVYKEHFFAGPKDLNVLEGYEKSMKIRSFARSVDFGILYFITRPIFNILQIFHKFVGNFGVAIILLTLFVRMLMLPLSIKSCTSMMKIKKLQPEISKIKSLYSDNKEAMNKKSVALFKKHNVTPMSGCLPTLLQVPVFFALYKVLFITIEMRQAPFFLWIKDLSAPDPTNILNLFGLFSWSPSFFLSIGVLPITLGITVALQQKLTSAKYEDPTQAFMARSMPYIFTILFASFPSGLVLYWIFNNIISITQQLIITKFLFYKRENKKSKEIYKSLSI